MPANVRATRSSEPTTLSSFILARPLRWSLLGANLGGSDADRRLSIRRRREENAAKRDLVKLLAARCALTHENQLRMIIHMRRDHGDSEGRVQFRGQPIEGKELLPD